MALIGMDEWLHLSEDIAAHYFKVLRLNACCEPAGLYTFTRTTRRLLFG